MYTPVKIDVIQEGRKVTSPQSEMHPSLSAGIDRNELTWYAVE
jgi:hypothetical protein